MPGPVCHTERQGRSLRSIVLSDSLTFAWTRVNSIAAEADSRFEDFATEVGTDCPVSRPLLPYTTSQISFSSRHQTGGGGLEGVGQSRRLSPNVQPF